MVCLLTAYESIPSSDQYYAIYHYYPLLYQTDSFHFGSFQVSRKKRKRTAGAGTSGREEPSFRHPNEPKIASTRIPYTRGITRHGIVEEVLRNKMEGLFSLLSQLGMRDNRHLEETIMPISFTPPDTTHVSNLNTYSLCRFLAFYLSNCGDRFGLIFHFDIKLPASEAERTA